MKTTQLTHLAAVLSTLLVSTTLAAPAPQASLAEALAASGLEGLQITVNVAPAAPAAAAANVQAAGLADQVFALTSNNLVNAVPEQVTAAEAPFTPTGGLAGALGTFNFGINSATETICWNITLTNFQGEFASPALTATHIHEAALGASGPPRIAFPNPVPVPGAEGVMNSVGCQTGPFTTGIVVDGADTGAGFSVAAIEADPAAFFADVHSSLALPGAVRGQLA